MAISGVEVAATLPSRKGVSLPLLGARRFDIKFNISQRKEARFLVKLCAAAGRECSVGVRRKRDGE